MGYYVSPKYGLILEHENDETAVADIRYCEKLVVLPYWNKKETEENKRKTEQVNRLKKILDKEIEFRDISESDYNYEKSKKNASSPVH